MSVERAAVVAVFGDGVDIDREFGWIQKLLASSLNLPRLHCTFYPTGAKHFILPDIYPDIAIYIGTAKTKPLAKCFSIWVETAGCHSKEPCSAFSACFGLSADSRNPNAPIDTQQGASFGNEIVITPTHRLLLDRASIVRSAASAAASNSKTSNLWPMIVGGDNDRMKEYATSVDVKAWMRDRPSLDMAGYGEIQLLLEKSIHAQTQIMRLRYQNQIAQARKETTLQCTRLFQSLGPEGKKRAQMQLWPLVAPLAIDVASSSSSPPDEKGVIHIGANSVKSGVKSEVTIPSIAPRGVLREAIYEFLECSLDCDEKEYIVGARQLMRKFLVPFADDPRWLSILLAWHQYSTPYAANHPERHIASVIIVGATEQDKKSRMEEQWRQLTELARVPIVKESNSSLHWESTLAGALKHISEFPSVSERDWNLILDASQGATFGPMFLRDWIALTELLPHLSEKWDAVRLGFHLPAIETVTAMCNTKTKRLAATNSKLTEMHAFAISTLAAKKIIHSVDHNPRSLTLSQPTIFFAPL
jgi:hypothetical protein